MVYVALSLCMPPNIAFCMLLITLCTLLRGSPLSFHLLPTYTSTHTHRKLIVGGEDIAPDGVDEREDHTTYTLTWLTNGYTSTQKGRRHELRFSFMFDNLELAESFQVKFYPVQSSTHLTWGTTIERIELEARSSKPLTEAVNFQTLSPTNITFK